MYVRKFIRNQIRKKYGSAAVQELWRQHQIEKYGSRGAILEINFQNLPAKRRKFLGKEVGL